MIEVIIVSIIVLILKKTAGNMLPTVMYPELYRKRFCEAMGTVVPDKLTRLGADVRQVLT